MRSGTQRILNRFSPNLLQTHLTSQEASSSLKRGRLVASKKRVTDGFQNVKTLYSTNLLSILVLVQFSKTATPLFCKLYFYIQVARHQTRKFQFKYTRGNDFCIYESLRKSNFKGKAQLSLNFKGKIIRNKYSNFF